MYIHTYIHTYTHTYMHTYIYIHTHNHTYIHTYIHTHTYTHTHTVIVERSDRRKVETAGRTLSCRYRGDKLHPLTHKLTTSQTSGFIIMISIVVVVAAIVVCLAYIYKDIVVYVDLYQHLMTAFSFITIPDLPSFLYITLHI